MVGVVEGVNFYIFWHIIQHRVQVINDACSEVFEDGFFLCPQSCESPHRVIGGGNERLFP